ncbi:DUF805 domain-containing protein [uncultured Dialister sp.]|uniref:DUF805 domain-containing protein n=1 Tax=uncultured Dialister sp. TaxID=278064 RepID=UPI0025E7F9D6|nr:DUF805 domain-containing protein [uncultured Dialister sp.]
MAMDFEIPDITENAGKAATGRKQRKPRKAGTLRLGETLRQISHNYTATRESEDEDKHVEFYSLSEGPEKFDFYGTEVSIVGVCVRNKKTAAIYMELPSGNRADFIKTVAKSEGEPQDAAGMTIFADTVTSLFITKPQKGENVVTIALMDSEDAKALSNNAAIEEREAEEKKGISHKIIKTWFDPVGRMSRKTYIKRMPGMLIPSIILFVITVLRPELFVGEANPFIVGFLILGTLCFISLISLGMRRLSDIGKSHWYYWIFFLILLAINQLGGNFLGSQLNATRTVAVIFFIAIVVLAFFPGEAKKNKYGLVPKD